ncbi:hypothetical protein Aph01nite_79470 [Acrocarpospora phusangensis]|uniref:Core-binding (CB) domain-containing protein n=1 Tax=Acrocarpospora phusangensis TaxID=1070424 RepID=A0A919QP17_9ACTN|nr:N-terminal phage integrase SAM-like domain-containing protein [Acrocarpospora phusangensis]GIH29637.1 hypothetical protein Aph01nite_79470 [Acrocarpospora phusangensis]
MAWEGKRGPWYRVRYRDADGGVQTTPDKYPTKTAAEAAARDLESRQRHGSFINPQVGRVLLADWAADWRRVHQVSPSTRAKYDHHLDQHILPVFGQVRLDQIRRMAVKEWAADLGARYAPATVSGILTLLSVVMNAAVQE